jgi:peptide/nickel transport system permease protein
MQEPEIDARDSVAAPVAALVDAPVVPGRRRWDVGMALALTCVAIVAGAAIFADVLPIDDPLALDPAASRTGPSRSHLLGADQLGRDLLAQIAHGARVSLLVGFVATGFAVLVGGTVGLMAGFLRGKVETFLMAVVDIMLSVPALILAIALTAFLGASLRNVILAIAILAVPAFARMSRAQALSISERDFVRAARSLGAGRTRILLFEVAPNVAPSVLAYSLIIVAVAIVVEGSLSFLGLGVPPPRPTWGGMISAGKSDLSSAPHISMIPAAVMFVTILSLNVVGEKLRRRFDVRRERVR